MLEVYYYSLGVLNVFIPSVFEEECPDWWDQTGSGWICQPLWFR